MCVFPCEDNEKEGEGERNSMQWTILSDEADGNHSVDRQDMKVGEEEMGLDIK